MLILNLKKQKKIIFLSEVQLFRFEMQCYFIYMASAASLIAHHFDRIYFWLLFRVYGVVSLHWHHERWPANVQLFLVCEHKTLL